VTTKTIARPKEIRPETYRMYLVIKYVAWIGILAHTSFIPLFFWMGVPFMGASNFLSVSMWLAVRWANGKGRIGMALSLILTEVSLHAFLAVSFVGWSSGFHYYILALIPFAAMNDRMKPRLMVGEIAGLIAMYLVLYTFTKDIVFYGPPGPIMKLVPYANVAISTTAIGVITYYFRIASMTAETSLKRLASTDTLTGLFNRRRMMEALNGQHARSKRTGQPAALLIADIDHFKRFNDERGHQFGDVVLCRVATALKESLREQDVCARWGGEEFLMLLPDTDLEGAEQVARKLNQAVQNLDLDEGAGRVAVTLTLGVAMLEPTREIYESVRVADDALYHGKKSGRNRVVTRNITELSDARG